MFILHQDKPYFVNLEKGKMYGLTIDALTYKVNYEQETDRPAAISALLTVDELRAKLGLLRQQVVNKRTNMLETTSNKTVTTTIDALLKAAVRPKEETSIGKES